MTEPPTHADKHVLIVDDEPDIRELLSMTVGAMGVDTAEASDLTAAKRQLASQRFGAFDFLSKPLDLVNLRNIVATALQLDADGEHEQPTAALLGNSEVMDGVRDIIQRVARSQAPVHIRGESGTGKELVARMIHDASG